MVPALRKFPLRSLSAQGGGMGRFCWWPHLGPCLDSESWEGGVCSCPGISCRGGRRPALVLLLVVGEPQDGP